MHDDLNFQSQLQTFRCGMDLNGTIWNLVLKKSLGLKTHLGRQFPGELLSQPFS